LNAIAAEQAGSDALWTRVLAADLTARRTRPNSSMRREASAEEGELAGLLVNGQPNDVGALVEFGRTQRSARDRTGAMTTLRKALDLGVGTCPLRWRTIAAVASRHGEAAIAKQARAESDRLRGRRPRPLRRFLVRKPVFRIALWVCLALWVLAMWS